ncbi:MAG TPA: ABC transporter permease [Oscillospiraceae bacterium]|nr:ABC transporter permease [Oscillospiraceae bacterium]
MSFFAMRNLKEMLRDKLNLFFGLAFPLLILILLFLLNRNIPAQAGMTLFHLENLTPGVAVFGLSFVSLFGGMLIARDRSEAFLLRLYSSPLRAGDFLTGYTLPLLPLCVGQGICCFAAAFALGLRCSVGNFLLCLAVLLPAAVLFIGIGLLCGSCMTDKQVGGICGALLTNLSAWLSGTWFSLDLFGAAGKRIAYCLPFANAVDAARAAVGGDYGAIPGKLWIVAVYAAVLFAAAVLVFSRNRSSGRV